jgi:hypothetical protein
MADKLRIAVEVLNGATGEVREVIANVLADTEQDAVNLLFAGARRDDFYYRFLGMNSVIARTLQGAKPVEYQSQTYYALEG